MQAPDTVSSFKGIFQPLLDKQTVELKKEMSEIKTELCTQKKKIDHLEKQVDGLKSENRTLNQATQQQQRFMEYVDMDQRKHNIIMTGMQESRDLVLQDGHILTNDIEKTQHVMHKIGHPNVKIDSIHRLGKPPTAPNTRPWPIQIVLESHENRMDILKSSRALKEAGEALSKVYI